jgi:hypothetical protein
MCSFIVYTLNILIDFYHFGHFLLDMINTKFKNISKIGVWSYFGAPYVHEGMVCQSGANERLTQ